MNGKFPPSFCCYLPVIHSSHRKLVSDFIWPGNGKVEVANILARLTCQVWPVKCRFSDDQSCRLNVTVVSNMALDIRLS